MVTKYHFYISLGRVIITCNYIDQICNKVGTQPCYIKVMQLCEAFTKVLNNRVECSYSSGSCLPSCFRRLDGREVCRPTAYHCSFCYHYIWYRDLLASAKVEQTIGSQCHNLSSRFASESTNYLHSTY